MWYNKWYEKTHFYPTTDRCVRRALKRLKILIQRQLLSWPPVDTWSASDTLLPRFEAFFSSVYQIEDQTLLLLNDFHRLFGGEPSPAAIDLASSLVSTLARREIQLLGTSTLTEYQQYIERFAAIECRLQGIVLQSDEELQQKSVSY